MGQFTSRSWLFLHTRINEKGLSAFDQGRIGQAQSHPRSGGCRTMWSDARWASPSPRALGAFDLPQPVLRLRLGGLLDLAMGSSQLNHASRRSPVAPANHQRSARWNWATARPLMMQGMMGTGAWRHDVGDGPVRASIFAPTARDIWCLEIRWSARACGSFARGGERLSVCSNPVRSGAIKRARGTRTSGGTQYETTSFDLAVRVDRRGRGSGSARDLPRLISGDCT